jgi:hypothetical protein
VDRSGHRGLGRFYPFRARLAVRRSAGPLDGAVTNSKGFLSDKGSGVMFYVIRLA